MPNETHGKGQYNTSHMGRGRGSITRVTWEGGGVALYGRGGGAVPHGKGAGQYQCFAVPSSSPEGRPRYPGAAVSASSTPQCPPAKATGTGESNRSYVKGGRRSGQLPHKEAELQ